MARSHRVSSSEGLGIVSLSFIRSLPDFLRPNYPVSNQNKVLTTCLALLVVVEFSAIVVYYANIRDNVFFTQLSSHTTGVIEKTMCVFIVVTDISLAGSLVFLLRRRRSGFAKTDSIIKRLIAYIVSTSLVTVVVAALCIMSLFAFPRTFLFISFAHFISQCMFDFTYKYMTVTDLLSTSRLRQLHVRLVSHPNRSLLRASFIVPLG